jgi:tetratricopeptide (TPR) repeat protein
MIWIVLLTGAITLCIFLFSRSKAESIMERAFNARENGRVDEAIALYTEAASEMPGNWVVFYYRAICRLKAGDKAGAIRDLENAIKVNSRYSGKAQELLDEVNGGVIKIGKELDDLFK